MSDVQPIALHDAARQRYLNYAMSVITARALPDVRDGLKPVQRRILYCMFHDLNLLPSNKYKKCAAVVGDVMAKYHPHGDSSIYEALVRMAQDFSLRDPLIDPQGNFGSLDGDPPAAFRYTECRLRDLALELLTELKQDTVDMEDTYDGERQQPVVLPAQFPQLLVNGVEGIAVGLSTKIPPHNLGEIIDGCVAIIDGKAHDTADLLDVIRGPDFPTAGRILNDRASLLELYETGHGSIKLRGEWTTEKEDRRERVIITSIPYALNKAKLVARIGADIGARKLPQVVDIRDESTEDVRIVLDLKQGASAEAVMAFLYKRTPLEGSFSVHMNALVPPEREGEIPQPRRLSLYDALQYWLDFRYETVRRRLAHELAKLERRIHILEGYALIFPILDEVIAIIRASKGKSDAAKRLMEAFPLDAEQTEAILMLHLYRIASLEIALILEELEEKRAAAAEIRRTMASEALMWGTVRSELLELRSAYATPRRTTIGEPVQALEFDESAYIVREDTYLVVTRGGWVKRQSSFSAIDKIRIRDTDAIAWLYKTDTQSTVTFFASDGGAYTLRVGDVPATTGHGEPLTRHFQVADGSHVAGVIVHDKRHFEHLPDPPDDVEGGPHVVSVTRLGRIQRLPLSLYAEPSNRNGRRFARLGDDDGVLAAYPSRGGEYVCLASSDGNVLAFPVHEANVLKSAGKGTTAMKLKAGDALIAFELSTSTIRGPTVSTTNGREVTVTMRSAGGARAARGKSVIRRGGLENWQVEQYLWLGKPGDDATPGGEE
jgi:DNA gyrase subunit A